MKQQQLQIELNLIHNKTVTRSEPIYISQNKKNHNKSPRSIRKNLETINESAIKSKNRRTLKLNTDVQKFIPRKQSSRFQLPGLSGPLQSSQSPDLELTSPRFRMDEVLSPPLRPVAQTRRSPKVKEGLNMPIQSFDMELIKTLQDDQIKLPKVKSRYRNENNTSKNSSKL